MVKNYIYSEEVENSTHIGKWGMFHREYLKQKSPFQLSEMIKWAAMGIFNRFRQTGRLSVSVSD